MIEVYAVNFSLIGAASKFRDFVSTRCVENPHESSAFTCRRQSRPLKIQRETLHFGVVRGNFQRRFFCVRKVNYENVAGATGWKREKRFVRVGTENAKSIGVLICLEDEKLLWGLCECENFDDSLWKMEKC